MASATPSASVRRKNTSWSKEQGVQGLRRWSLQYLYKFILDHDKIFHLYNYLIFLLLLQVIENKYAFIISCNTTGCGDKSCQNTWHKIFMAHCSAMLCPQVTLSGDAEWPKVADAVIEASMMCQRWWSYLCPSRLTIFDWQVPFHRGGLRLSMTG